MAVSRRWGGGRAHTDRRAGFMQPCATPGHEVLLLNIPASTCEHPKSIALSHGLSNSTLSGVLYGCRLSLRQKLAVQGTIDTREACVGAGTGLQVLATTHMHPSACYHYARGMQLGMQLGVVKGSRRRMGRMRARLVTHRNDEPHSRQTEHRVITSPPPPPTHRCTCTFACRVLRLCACPNRRGMRRPVQFPTCLA